MPAPFAPQKGSQTNIPHPAVVEALPSLLATPIQESVAIVIEPLDHPDVSCGDRISSWCVLARKYNSNIFVVLIPSPPLRSIRNPLYSGSFHAGANSPQMRSSPRFLPHTIHMTLLPSTLITLVQIILMMDQVEPGDRLQNLRQIYTPHACAGTLPI
jgi:hypothetical protein